LIITIRRHMSDDTVQTPSPAQSLQKQKKRTPWIIIGVVIIVVVALIAVVVLGGFLNTENDVLKKVQNRGQLIVGTQVPYAPFEYQNINGTYAGIDMEIAQRVAHALNVTLVIKSMDFDPLFGAVQTGQIDMAISSITITAARQQTVNFTIPYYTANQAVLEKTTSNYTTLNSLNGTKIVTQLGTTGSDWVNTNLVGTGRITAADHVDLTDVSAAATGVQNGIYNAFVVDTPVAYGYAANASTGLSVGFVIPTNEHYGICIQQNQANFRNAVDNVIQSMIDDGSLHALLLKYHAIGA
jgi:ABC-type amino acid transport substrate-binding protein